MEVYTVFTNGLNTRVSPVEDSEWWVKNYGFIHFCYECCNGDRCDSDCIATYKGRRKECPHCNGKGSIRVEDIEYCVIKI